MSSNEPAPPTHLIESVRQGIQKLEQGISALDFEIKSREQDYQRAREKRVRLKRQLNHSIMLIIRANTIAKVRQRRLDKYIELQAARARFTELTGESAPVTAQPLTHLAQGQDMALNPAQAPGNQWSMPEPELYQLIQEGQKRLKNMEATVESLNKDIKNSRLWLFLFPVFFIISLALGMPLALLGGSVSAIGFVMMFLSIEAVKRQKTRQIEELETTRIRVNQMKQQAQSISLQTPLSTK